MLSFITINWKDKPRHVQSKSHTELNGIYSQLRYV